MNIEYQKINELLNKNNIKFEIESLYKIGEVILKNEKQLESIKQEINTQNFEYLLTLNEIDLKKDLIQIYFIEDNKRENILVGLIDPFELYDNPQIIAVAKNVLVDRNIIEEKKIIK